MVELIPASGRVRLTDHEAKRFVPADLQAKVRTSRIPSHFVQTKGLRVLTPRSVDRSRCVCAKLRTSGIALGAQTWERESEGNGR